jgi:hypothetical protein
VRLVFAAEAWVRTPDDTPGTNAIRLIQRIYSAAGEIEATATTSLAPDTQWRKVSGHHEVTQAGAIELYVEGRATTGDECFLVDDVILRRER